MEQQAEQKAEVKTPTKPVTIKLTKKLEINFDTGNVEAKYILWKDDNCEMVTLDPDKAMRGFIALVGFIEEHGETYPKVELIRKHEIPLQTT